MRPILLSGHTRALTQVKYSSDGDLIFSVSKDQLPSVWFSSNGERLGSYQGHVGAVWTVDVNPDTTLLATGAADNTMRLWDVQTGKLLKTWDFESSIKRVEFSQDGRQLLAVTEKRTNILSSIMVYDIIPNVDAEQSSEHVLRIVCDESKATVAGFGFDAKYIIAGHEDGSVSQYDGQTGEFIDNITVHEPDHPVTDLQWSSDRTYFITASKDKTSKVQIYMNAVNLSDLNQLITTEELNVLKTYIADTPLNSATITPTKDYVILGGGQAAMDVTTTSARQGKFEARFYHKIFEDEIGRVRGHFGPLNYVAVDPKGKSYASGGEDGYVRLHHFDRSFNDFQYEVEREAATGRL